MRAARLGDTPMGGRSDLTEPRDRRRTAGKAEPRPHLLISGTKAPDGSCGMTGGGVTLGQLRPAQRFRKTPDRRFGFAEGGSLAGYESAFPRGLKSISLVTERPMATSASAGGELVGGAMPRSRGVGAAFDRPCGWGAGTASRWFSMRQSDHAPLLRFLMLVTAGSAEGRCFVLRLPANGNSNAG